MCSLEEEAVVQSKAEVGNRELLRNRLGVHIVRPEDKAEEELQGKAELVGNPEGEHLGKEPKGNLGEGHLDMVDLEDSPGVDTEAANLDMPVDIGLGKVAVVEDMGMVGELHLVAFNKAFVDIEDLHMRLWLRQEL